jgi:hypothetical protein
MLPALGGCPYTYDESITPALTPEMTSPETRRRRILVYHCNVAIHGKGNQHK